MLVRSERSADVPAISQVLADAFQRPDSPGASVPEVGLVSSLRESKAWIPQQSLVAEVDDEVVGHCLCTRAHVGDVPCLALGPIGVLVEWQRQGIGTALINQAVEVAIDMGEPLIGLLGDHGYYRKFGFVAAREVGIESPDPSWGDYFQVKMLSTHEPVTGMFRYSETFRI